MIKNNNKNLEYLAGSISVGRIIGGQQGGPLTALADPNQSGFLLAEVISTAIGAMTVIAAIYFIFQIITGGIAIMNSQGDPGKVESARQSITNGLIGMIVVSTATILVSLIAWLIGFDNPFDLDTIIGTIALTV